MSDECSSEWERRKQFIRNGFPMLHCGGRRYTMPDDIAEELKVRAAIEQVEGTVFERAAVEIERLRQLSGDSGQLRKERDEARREICRNEADDISMELGGAAIFAASVAKRRGWDCFEEAKP